MFDGGRGHALGSDGGVAVEIRYVFVFDEDIDIRNSHERDWALAHRFMADRDLVVIPNAIGMPIDPLAQGTMGGRARLGVHDGHPEIPANTRTFMAVDWTTPLGLDLMQRVTPKPEVEARVDNVWSGINDGARQAIALALSHARYRRGGMGMLPDRAPNISRLNVSG